MAEISKNSKVTAVFLISETENIWTAVESVLYRNGKRLHYAKRGELPIIRARQIERGIMLSFVNGDAWCRMSGIKTFKLKPKENDSFVKNELSRNSGTHFFTTKAAMPLQPSKALHPASSLTLSFSIALATRFFASKVLSSFIISQSSENCTTKFVNLANKNRPTTRMASLSLTSDCEWSHEVRVMVSIVQPLLCAFRTKLQEDFFVQKKNASR